MPRVVHFEIHADNPERAVAFYASVFGWQMTKWDGPMEYWLIKTGPDSERGIDGGLLKRPGPPAVEGQPVNSHINTIDVANLDDAIMSVEKAGGSVALPKMPVPGVGWLAYVKDTEGNIFGMMQFEKGAMNGK